MPLLAMQRDTIQGDGRLPALYRQAMRRKGKAPRRAPTLKLSYDYTRKYTGAHGQQRCFGQLEYLGHFAAISIPVGSANKIKALANQAALLQTFLKRRSLSVAMATHDTPHWAYQWRATGSVPYWIC